MPNFVILRNPNKLKDNKSKQETSIAVSPAANSTLHLEIKLEKLQVVRTPIVKNVPILSYNQISNTI